MSCARSGIYFKVSVNEALSRTGLKVKENNKDLISLMNNESVLSGFFIILLRILFSLSFMFLRIASTKIFINLYKI